MRLALLSPQQVVSQLAKEPATSPFMLKVAIIAAIDPRYRRAGVAKVFIQKVSSGQSTGDIPHWQYPMLGIINVLASICTDQSRQRDVAILREVYSAYQQIFDVIVKDFHLLTPLNKLGDNRRGVVAAALSLFREDPETKRKLYELGMLRLIVHSGTGPLPPPDYLERIFQAVNMPRFVSRFNFLFKQKHIPGDALWQDLSLAMHLTRGSWLPFGPHFTQAGVPKQVLLAILRSLKGPSEHLCILFSLGEVFTQELILNSPYPMGTLADMINNTRLIEVAAEGFKMANQAPPHTQRIDDAGTFYQFFQNIGHALGCADTTGCKLHCTPAFRDAMRANVERIGITTSISLQEELGADGKYLELWTGLTRLLGITDKSIRERSAEQDEEGVSEMWFGILLQSSVPEELTEPSYYSDWKNHKHECKALLEDA
ncbi:unnamed protein product [Cyclocybe aegerita]|uniref:Uncharacterized protein n=1 Tax=Cyclocybe aegerita TaxID=1973307 RepID=A0A8S0X600_CYCAE|nr:unnamed protein product [Cyclocybe aegerita]